MVRGRIRLESTTSPPGVAGHTPRRSSCTGDRPDGSERGTYPRTSYLAPVVRTRGEPPPGSDSPTRSISPVCGRPRVPWDRTLRPPRPTVGRTARSVGGGGPGQGWRPDRVAGGPNYEW